VLDIGQSQDWLALQIAMAPCLLGYGVLAEQLHADTRSKREGNTYWPWIQNYVAEDYVTAVKTGSGEWRAWKPNVGHWQTTDSEQTELLERHALLQSPSRIEELAKVFIHATKVSRMDHGRPVAVVC
jgi:thiaminase